MPRRAQLRTLYGFDFPDDLFAMWDFACSLAPDDPLLAFEETLGITLVGPFDVLAGRFDDVDLRYSPLLHWRYSLDPPEFFTVFNTEQVGFHWGYWFDCPQTGEAWVTAYGFASSVQQLSFAGFDLFEAVRGHLEWQDEEAEEVLLARGQRIAEDDKAVLIAKRDALAALRKAILPHAPGELRGNAYVQSFAEMTIERGFVIPTSEGMGVAIPEDMYQPFDDADGAFSLEDLPAWEANALSMVEAGFPGAALLLGRELLRFEQFAAVCHGLLSQAYKALHRPVLQRVVHEVFVTPYRVDPSILSHKIGDFLVLEEALAQAERVHKLELGGQSLGQLPDAIGRLTSMTYLDVWGNQLRELPDALKDCSALHTLMLHLNQFVEIPSVVGSLPGLEVLFVSRCQLRQLGAWLGRCQSLRHLDLHQNKLTASPDSLSPALFGLSSLEILSLAENRLEELPAGIGEMMSLKKLNLRGNRLTSLPGSLGQMTALERLDLRDNQIESLSFDVSGLSSLKQLLLEGNPLPPGEVTRLQLALPDVDILL